MMESFEDFPIQSTILKAIYELGYSLPSPIQSKTIKPILSGNQVVGIAQTGTGKTAAYAIPLISKLSFAQGVYPRVLVLAPTRELAIQITKHIQLIATFTDLRIGVVYGGTGTQEQKKLIEKGLDILIGTPGRLWDFYKNGTLNFKNLAHLVLDEADKLMDMGFMPILNQFLEILPRKRQTLLFSATMSPKVERLYGEFMEFPLVVAVSPVDSPAIGIDQKVFIAPNFKTKINLLEYFLNLYINIVPVEISQGQVTSPLEIKKIAEGNSKTLVEKDSFPNKEGNSHESEIEPSLPPKDLIFCKNKRTANLIYPFLVRRYGENTTKIIHGNKDQNTRINAIKAFESGSISYLIATDVVARGIDIKGINRVFNFDIPMVTEDYVHRIGRTARAGKKGEAITFCSPEEEFYLLRIEKLMKQEIPRLELPDQVEITETPYEEKQKQDLEIDNQRKKMDPDFKGAFHEKKNLHEKKNMHENKTIPNKRANSDRKISSHKKTNFDKKNTPKIKYE